MPKRAHLLLSVFFLFCCSSLSAEPVIGSEKVPEYDYSQTELIIFYGDKGHVYLGPIFEQAAPGMGALVYEMILLYVPQFQDIIIPPGNPTHIIDLLMRDRNGWQRIGQRLYMGDAWLSDGKSIAFLKPQDYRHLAGLLHDRYVGAGTDIYDPEDLADMRRPTKEELPEDWLAGPESVGKAIDRMQPSDFAYEGYDPGAAIRRRAGHETDSRRNSYTEERKLDNKANLTRQVVREAPPVTQQFTSQPSPKESRTIKNNNPEPATIPLQQKMPHRQVPNEKVTQAGEEVTKGKPDRRLLFVFFVGLAIVLSACAIVYNRKYGNAS